MAQPFAEIDRGCHEVPLRGEQTRRSLPLTASPASPAKDRRANAPTRPPAISSGPITWVVVSRGRWTFCSALPPEPLACPVPALRQPSGSSPSSRAAGRFRRASGLCRFSSPARPSLTVISTLDRKNHAPLASSGPLCGLNACTRRQGPLWDSASRGSGGRARSYGERPGTPTTGARPWGSLQDHCK